MEILNGAPLAERNTATGFPTHLSSYELGRLPSLARVRAVTRVGCVERTEPENVVGGHSAEKRKSMLVQPRGV